MVCLQIQNRQRFALFVRLTLAITWPQGIYVEEDNLAVTAQVNGGVSHFFSCRIVKDNIPKHMRRALKASVLADHEASLQLQMEHQGNARPSCVTHMQCKEVCLALV